MGIHVIKSSMPFQWKNKMYQVGSCGVDDNGVAYASTTPDEPELIEELKRRMLAHKALKVYLANGYTRFVEDYEST